MKYSHINLSLMTYTFKCDNKKCEKIIISILSKLDGPEYYGRCKYCNSGRLKLVKNIDLCGVLIEQKIIQKKERKDKAQESNDD
tara:strand:+ start:114 stop:365 length:252 start_codon:yes stop_codon:yes gene_type:complete